MGRPPKATKVIKSLFFLVTAHWQRIAVALSGLTLCGIMAGLGLFWGVLARILNKPVPLWVVVAVLPLSGYAVVTMILGMIKAAKEPPFLKFRSMKYGPWKLEWEYEYVRKTGKYAAKEIWPVCCKCGCKLVEHEDRRDLCRCPECECKYSATILFDRRAAAAAVIERKMEKWSDTSVRLHPTPIEIQNTLSAPVQLSAGGYLGAEPVKVDANWNDSANTIYAKKPVFTARAEGSPATVNFQIVDGTMYVTIR